MAFLASWITSPSDPNGWAHPGRGIFPVDALSCPAFEVCCRESGLVCVLSLVGFRSAFNWRNSMSVEVPFLLLQVLHDNYILRRWSGPPSSLGIMCSIPSWSYGYRLPQ